jgi:FkbM family methyltransferase
VSSSLIYTDWPEYNELKFIRNQLGAGELVLDVGANVGHISLLLSDIVGPEAIFAFEPTPLTFGRLVNNWELNGWKTENLFQVAVGASDATTLVPDVTHPLTTNAIQTEHEAGGLLTRVPLVALDSMRSLWQKQTIGLLKIDVEGYEAEVFRGATALLQELRPRLIMFESLTPTVDQRILLTLRNNDYTTFQIGEDGKPDYAGAGAQNMFAIPVELAKRDTAGSR